ncbi:MAG: phosphomannose isomerase type II C-terminal cupin domain [Minisyncoccia bacterium]
MKELKPFTDNRPWGWFRDFIDNKSCTVKILFVKKGEAFSLQKHLRRDEFWRVLKGEPEITLGDKIIEAKPGDEFEVSRKTIHRIYSPNTDSEILEISRGKFDENDIIRIEDKYGRA